MNARRLLRSIPHPVVLVALLVSSILVACSEHPVSHRKPAQVFTGSEWLEREDREAEERPDELLEILRLKSGDRVADVGCGTGYFARRMAGRVIPGGVIYAEDIQPQMLERVRQRAEEDGISNIETILGTETDPKLPAGGIDLILLVDVYHEFQKPQEMLANLRKALAPGGRVTLVEYRLEGDTALHISLEHRMSVEQVLAEWTPAGFELVERIESLPTQHLFLFRKR
ncbi:MAG TPA: methyltransferase domain-containing protein [Thermoanaerobaculia bacterium]|jgi:ubiquinone/menaquinone biosynthesis C-methylase UbiE|nr:methyltransferase domain-containing protein [Thermoanaerobaculia bacterium]